MLYLTGYGLTLEDIKQFRQWGSRTPGHPEIHLTTGVEVTTGPLGQGLADGVGLGLAERWLRARFGPELVDHYTFVLCSDGDLEEGISHEAGSLAGHLGLGRLIYVYDDNHISIDGPTELAYSDNVPERFAAYGWHTEDIGEVANDTDALEAAVRRAMAVEDKPSMISLRSHIGWPAPGVMDTAAAHGSPLGDEEIAKTKSILGLPPEETFWVPEEVLDFYRASTAPWTPEASGVAGALRRLEGRPGRLGRRPGRTWGVGLGDEAPLVRGRKGHGHPSGRQRLYQRHRRAHPGPHGRIGRPDREQRGGPRGRRGPGGRKPRLGAQIHFGIREHVMGAVMNGLALHGGVLPVGGTFFVFSDYMRPAVRLAALSEAHVIYSGPTTPSASARTARPTSRSSTLPPCGPCPACGSSGRPTPTRRPTPGGWPSTATGRPPSSCRARPSRFSRPPPAPATVWPGAATSWWNEAGGPPEIVLVGTGSEGHLCVQAAADLVHRSGGKPSGPGWCRCRLGAVRRAGRGLPRRVLPRSVPTLAVEAADLVRVGPLRRRLDLHRPLRRLGPRR